MTQPNRHRIQRQVVELAIGSGLSGPAVQESFARSYHDEIVPEIEAVFDRAASAHELLRIERLEIDLGRIENSDWQAELCRRLGVELAQRLARYQPEATADPRSAPEGHSGEPLRQFLYFLEHGRIPWWGTRPEAGWSAALSGVRLDGFPLRAILQTDPGARLRFMDALDDNLLDQVVAAWCGVYHSERALELLARSAILMQARTGWRRRFWSRLLEAALEPGLLPARGPELLRELLDAPHTAGLELDVIPPAPARVSAVATGGVEPGAKPDDMPSPWREWLAAAQNLGAAGRGSRLAPVLPENAERRGAPPPALRARREMPAARTQPDEDAIYLGGAGAILLHPFLEPLFRDRGLLETRDFRDTDARERAVHLVGLLTFGCRDVPEYDLVAAKLLCGHLLDQPVAPVTLEDADAAACGELLAAVLGHWSALRSSSADWLRVQFLLRDGKLEQVDGGFRLTVERRAQDILLARLPWGIGVIGFPWMKEKIFVRWLD